MGGDREITDPRLCSGPKIKKKTKKKSTKKKEISKAKKKGPFDPRKQKKTVVVTGFFLPSFIGLDRF